MEELEQWFRVAARAKLKDAVLTALLRPEDGQRRIGDWRVCLAELGIRRGVRPAGTRPFAAGATARKSPPTCGRW